MPAPPNLSFDQAPNPGMVFGCLMPAPWVGAAAGIWLALGPVAGLPSRFAPLALSLVHLLAIGMLMPVMVGALFQMMPVLGGVVVPRARHIAPWLALGCLTIAISLSRGFLKGEAFGFALAATLVLAGLCPVAMAIAKAGAGVVPVNASTRVLAVIAWALLMTICLGAALALALGFGVSMPISAILDLHVAWGLGGWIATLIVGVATTVLPMFWQTPRLPDFLAGSLPGVMWLPLVLGAFELGGLHLPWRWLAMACLLLFAIIGLYGVLRAKRHHDPAWPLWVCALLSWVCALVLGMTQDYLPTAWPVAWWIGALVLVGGCVLPVNAMLGKIVPFLVWLRLRKCLPARVKVPAMQTLLRPALLRVQTGLVLLALTLLLILPVEPVLCARLAGATFALSQAWLGVLLLRVVYRFLVVQAASLAPSQPR
ncbi:hypothetical protein [Chitinimonas naiadis]